MAFAERLGNFIWNPWLLGLFLLSGLYLLRRAGGGVLDVGVRLSGHDDRMCRKDPGGALPGEKPGRRLAGRPHVLHGAGSGQPDAGRPVFPVLCGRLPGGRKCGAGQLHRRLPGGGLRLGPAGGGTGGGRADRTGDPGRHRAHRAGQRNPGALHGPSVYRRRSDGADLPPGGHSRGAGAHRDGRRHPQGGPGGRHRVRHGRSHALRRGPRCIHKRGRHGLLRHRPRRLQRAGTGRAGDVGHF